MDAHARFSTGTKLKCRIKGEIITTSNLSMRRLCPGGGGLKARVGRGRRGVPRDHWFRKNDFNRKDRTGHSQWGRGPQEAATGRCSPGEDVSRVTDRPRREARPTGRRWPPGACRLHDTPGRHVGLHHPPPPPPRRARWLLTYRSTNQENPQGPETRDQKLTGPPLPAEAPPTS